MPHALFYFELADYTQQVIYFSMTRRIPACYVFLSACHNISHKQLDYLIYNIHKSNSMILEKWFRDKNSLKNNFLGFPGFG